MNLADAKAPTPKLWQVPSVGYYFNINTKYVSSTIPHVSCCSQHGGKLESIRITVK